MPRTKISEFSATAASNTDIDSINIAEGCAPSGINDAIRELMAQLKDFQTGAVGDSFNGPVGSTTAAAGAFTTLTASSTLGVTGVATLGAGAILNTPASVTLTNATGLPLTTGTTGTLATTKGGTGLTSFTSGGVVYASSTSALATGSALTFDGTTFGVTGALSATGTSTLAAVNASGNITSTGTVGIANNSGYLMKDSAGNYRTMSILNGSNIMSFGDTDNFGASEVRLVAGTGNQLKLYGGNTLVATLTSTSLYTASGINVGFGTSSTSGARLNVVSTGANSRIAIGDTAADTYSTLLMYGGSGKYNFQLGVQNNVNNAFEITPSTAAGGTTFSTPAFVIDSSGNLGLGMTPTNFGNGYTVLQVANATNGGMLYLTNTSNAGGRIYGNGAGITYDAFSTTYHAFNTNGSERCRIDSSGNLLVAGTSADPIASAVAGISLGSDKIIRAQVVSNPSGIFGRLTTTGDLVRFYYSTSITLVGSISTNGTTTSYNTTSDQRLKENIQDADSASSLIDSLKVRQFDWKSDNSHQRYGFVAQELVTVVPEAVHQPTDTEEMMAVDYSKLVPMLVKEIQSLRKRLADAGI